MQQLNLMPPSNKYIVVYFCGLENKEEDGVGKKMGKPGKLTDSSKTDTIKCI